MFAIRSIGAGAALAVLAVIAWPGPEAAAQGSFLDKAKQLLGSPSTPAPAPSTSALTTGEIASGLRDALRVGTERVVGQLGKTDGFNSDPAIHIPLPGTLSKVQSTLRTVGMSSLADDLELRLNRAAEKATPEAKAVFWQAIQDMTLEDVQRVYETPPDGATRYFQGKMSAPLGQRMQPIVDESLSEVGAVAAYDRMLGEYKKVPFVPDAKADLTAYVIEKALDGIFHYLAKEEAAIRDNPAKRTTAILQRVFGST